MIFVKLTRMQKTFILQKLGCKNRQKKWVRMTKGKTSTFLLLLKYERAMTEKKSASYKQIGD